MDLEELIKRLEIAHKPVGELNEKKNELIDQEVMLLGKFINRIYPFATKKKIHGNDCVLIYVYKSSINDTMSNEVYLSPKGYITYQIYDERIYKGYAPDAEIEDGYSKIRVDRFLENRPLSTIIEFFDGRPQVLTKQEYQLSEENAKRSKFIQEFSKKLSGI